MGNADPSKIDEIRSIVYIENLNLRALNFLNKLEMFVQMEDNETKPNLFTFVELEDQNSALKVFVFSGAIFGDRPHKISHPTMHQ